jgi:hypothetical protein
MDNSGKYNPSDIGKQKWYQYWMDKGLLSFRTRPSGTLHHCYSTAQRHRRIAHGSHAQQYHSGYFGSPRAYAGQKCVLGTGNRPCLYCYRSQSGEQTTRSRHRQNNADPRRVFGPCLGVDTQTRRHHSWNS